MESVENADICQESTENHGFDCETTENPTKNHGNPCEICQNRGFADQNDRSDGDFDIEMVVEGIWLAQALSGHSRDPPRTFSGPWNPGFWRNFTVLRPTGPPFEGFGKVKTWKNHVLYTKNYEEMSVFYEK